MAAARPGASAAARRRRRAGLRVGLCWPKQRLRRRQEAGEGSGAGLAYRPGRAVRVDGLRVYGCLAAGAFQYTVSTCTTKLHAGSMRTGSTSIACVPIPQGTAVGASTRRLHSTCFEPRAIRSPQRRQVVSLIALLPPLPDRASGQSPSPPPQHVLRPQDRRPRRPCVSFSPPPLLGAPPPPPPPPHGGALRRSLRARRCRRR
eukprot:COSAG04_NODE_385_length_15323_cov_3.045586_2_plen_203_part_00